MLKNRIFQFLRGERADRKVPGTNRLGNHGLIDVNQCLSGDIGAAGLIGCAVLIAGKHAYGILYALNRGMVVAVYRPEQRAAHGRNGFFCFDFVIFVRAENAGNFGPYISQIQGDAGMTALVAQIVKGDVRICLKRRDGPVGPRQACTAGGRSDTPRDRLNEEWASALRLCSE